MTVEKLRKHHLQKTAFVYLRQSSPTQVKKNVEGSRRQRQMENRMKELGWPDARIRLLGGDTGNSGSTLHGRNDYQTIVEGVLGGQAGAVAARELSRLVRDNQDWNQLVRLCRHQDVLLEKCRENRHGVSPAGGRTGTDPSDPSDPISGTTVPRNLPRSCSVQPTVLPSASMNKE